MIADKFLGAVGLVQMHLIEHDSNLVRFVICLRYIPAWNITFQEIRFFHKFYVSFHAYIYFIRNITSSG